jgi:integrase
MVYIYSKASEAEKEKYGNINLILKLGVKNPVHGLPALEEFPEEAMIITHNQFKILYDELPSDHRYIAIIAAHTGLRKGNIVNLNWDQVNLEKEYICIDMHKGSRGNPKRNPLIIKLHQDLIKIFSFLEYRPGELIFPCGFNYRTWRKSCKRAGVEGLKLKDLRPNYTSWLVEAGATLSLLQCSLGHSTPLVTGRFYNKAQKATEILVPLQKSFLNC